MIYFSMMPLRTKISDLPAGTPDASQQACSRAAGNIYRHTPPRADVSDRITSRPLQLLLLSLHTPSSHCIDTKAFDGSGVKMTSHGAVITKMS